MIRCPIESKLPSKNRGVNPADRPEAIRRLVELGLKAKG
jgi:hypothetical protein